VTSTPANHSAQEPNELRDNYDRGRTSPETAKVESYRKARELEASIYGLNAAAEAINRCLQIIRRGSPQARIWRDRALKLAITIDVKRGAIEAT